jgi:hypothetical protein
MSVTVLNPQIHWAVETQAAKFFRRHLRDSDILTFWTAETGQWVLAVWLDKRKKIVEEFEDLGPNMEAITDEFVSMIVSCYGPVDLKRTKSRLLGRNKDRIQKQTEDILMDQDRWDWLRKRTAHLAPMPYVVGCPVSA